VLWVLWVLWSSGSFPPTPPHPSPPPPPPSSFLFCANPACALWRRPSFSGAPPPARAGHSATLIKTNIVVFGGGDQRRSFNDVHILDINVMAWSRPTDSGDVPHARTGHSATCIGDLLLIFGGGSPASEADNDMFVLDTGGAGAWRSGHCAGVAASMQVHALVVWM
jgi:hypothetical protein